MLNASIHTLVFDLDNTLIDRDHAIQLTVERWLELQGYDAEERQTVLPAIMQQDCRGYADRIVFCDWLLRTYGRDESREGSPQQLLSWFLENIIHHLEPDPLVQSILHALYTSFQLVLATNGGSITQRAKLRQAQLLSFFRPEAIFISEEVGYKKPDQQFFIKIMEDLELDPANTMVIGDHPVHDVQAARACGLLTCWVSHGRSWEHAVQPDHIITNITEANRWLELSI